MYLQERYCNGGKQSQMDDENTDLDDGTIGYDLAIYGDHNHLWESILGHSSYFIFPYVDVYFYYKNYQSIPYSSFNF